MLTGLIGKKIGMTQVTDPAGRVRAATVLTLGACTVSQVKTAVNSLQKSPRIWFRKGFMLCSSLKRLLPLSMGAEAAKKATPKQEEKIRKD